MGGRSKDPTLARIDPTALPVLVAGAGVRRLDELARIADEAGADRLAGEARSLFTRVRDGLFYVACVGQFKRGKSTLINALVGADILPSGVVPVTSVVTVLRNGESPRARVRLASGGWEDVDTGALAEYVSEERNPENARGVAAVEVFFPSPLLATGMCLVDTPGIGSVFTGNTEATRAFVPHVDAALVVLGADPPISADELSLVEEMGRQCPDLIFVLNKADRLTGAEREEGIGFTRRVLANRLGRKETAILEVSATERLAGAVPQRDWPALVDGLTDLARRSGSDLVRTAEDRGTGLLAARIRQHIEEARGALLRPVEKSKKRVEALRACVAEAERSLDDLDHLFASEQERLGRIFEGRKEEFLEGARPRARQELLMAVRAAKIRRGPALRSRAFVLADEISRQWLDRWRAEAQPAAESLYVQATRRFADLANEFVERLAASGDDALAGMPRAIDPEAGFRMRSRLYYTSLMALTGQTWLGWLLDLMRSRKQMILAVDRHVGDYLERLITANANRIVSDFNDRVLESRRVFQFEVRSVLEEVAASAERALTRAKECRAMGSQAVQEEVLRIDTLGDRLMALGLEGKEKRS